MVQGGDDSCSPRLLDVIERNRIIRPKPPPSLLHVLMIYSRVESGVTEHQSGTPGRSALREGSAGRLAKLDPATATGRSQGNALTPTLLSVPVFMLSTLIGSGFFRSRAGLDI
jgi:hypothetical protein